MSDDTKALVGALRSQTGEWAEPEWSVARRKQAADTIERLERELAEATCGGPLSEIAAERLRQQMEEGWTTEHDDEHSSCEMALAAAAYAQNSARDLGFSPRCWPWSESWWKPKDARRDLIRAGALIVAEIERLDRAAIAKERG